MKEALIAYQNSVIDNRFTFTREKNTKLEVNSVANTKKIPEQVELNKIPNKAKEDALSNSQDLKKVMTEKEQEMAVRTISLNKFKNKAEMSKDDRNEFGDRHPSRN
ncbi:hypothetical protein JTB14_036138 [Gonioctena quinquepunctata]|nr:hypothetical protein JTB14_036138 [Gonioctena quinquepunctata]